MKIIHYLEIENFKHFGEKQRIDLDHPSVLIGPNNCGKTTVIQAIALWSQAVKTWFDFKGKSPPTKRTATSLNRLSIVSVPVSNTRYFWHDTVVRNGRTNIAFEITAGILYENEILPLGMRFAYREQDLLYCVPTEDVLDRISDRASNYRGFVEAAAKIDVRLLYPMSGLETEEPILQQGRIDVLLGQGQTAQILRNLCFIALHSDPDNWEKIADRIERLFQVRLEEPRGNSRGCIDLFYHQPGIKYPLDIALAGRGLQQMLLILAHLYSHRGSVLLIDEPDAHLEILRQRQVYILLREIAEENGSQIVSTTHSEKVMEDAINHNLTLLLNGKAENIIESANRSGVWNSLKYFGAEHYYRARKSNHILYVEGKTDIDILKGFAKRLQHSEKHRSVSELLETANIYYQQDNYPESTIDSELEKAEGGYGEIPKRHFPAMKGMIPSLLGLAVLDRNSRQYDEQDEEKKNPKGSDISIMRWERYEIENYFIKPDLLKAFIRKNTTSGTPHHATDMTNGNNILERMILKDIFGENEDDFESWKAADKNLGNIVWEARTERMKMSDFGERFFRELSASSGQEMLLRKGNLYRLIELIEPEDIPKEVVDVLGKIHDLLTASSSS